MMAGSAVIPLFYADEVKRKIAWRARNLQHGVEQRRDKLTLFLGINR